MSPSFPDFPTKPITVVLCGVGGQGAITAADLLARAAMIEGYDVKVSEIHGMAQRGGSVSTTVRFGSCVSSMVCDSGQADVLISFELVEAVRNAGLLSPFGHLVVSDVAIKPMSVLAGLAPMPSVEDLHAGLTSVNCVSLDIFDAEGVARTAGNPRCSNVALLGAAARSLPIEDESWRQAISSRVPPKTLEANLRAFELGKTPR